MFDSRLIVRGMRRHNTIICSRQVLELYILWRWRGDGCGDTFCLTRLQNMHTSFNLLIVRIKFCGTEIGI